MTASKTPLVRSAPALTRRLVRPMPAVKMRRQHGRPWLLQGRTAAAPPRCNRRQPARNEGRPAKSPAASRRLKMAAASTAAASRRSTTGSARARQRRDDGQLRFHE